MQPSPLEFSLFVTYHFRPVLILVIFDEFLLLMLSWPVFFPFPLARNFYVPQICGSSLIYFSHDSSCGMKFRPCCVFSTNLPVFSASCVTPGLYVLTDRLNRRHGRVPISWFDGTIAFFLHVLHMDGGVDKPSAPLKNGSSRCWMGEHFMTPSTLRYGYGHFG